MSKQPVKRIVEVSHPYLLPCTHPGLYGGEIDFNLARLDTFDNDGLFNEPCIYNSDFYVPIIAENNKYLVVYNWWSVDKTIEYAHNGFILCQKIGIYELIDQNLYIDAIYKFSCPIAKPLHNGCRRTYTLQNFLDTLPHWLLISLDWS